jgi:hypothetical protein
MGMQLTRPSLTLLSTQNKAWLYYISLLCVVLLGFSSCFLSEIAQGQTSFAVSNIGIYTIVQYGLMALFMLLAWTLSPNSSKLRDYKVLFVAAFLVRAALIDVEPYTSNDVSRYLFDGRIAYEGHDPYKVSHDAIELTELRAKWLPPSEHAAYVTLYPPIALALFTFSASFGVENAQLVWKVLLLLAGLVTVWVTALVLKKAGKLENLALVALSPLLILETGVGLHIDAFSTLAVITALYFWQRQLLLYCGVVIGIGMAIKVLPVMLLLPLFFIQRSVKQAFTLVLGWFATIVFIYTITVLLGYVPIGSVGVFFEKWRNASPIFSTLDALLVNYYIVWSLVGMAITTALIIAYVSFYQGSTRGGNRSIIYICLQASLALPLVLSPVLFPWYLLPLVPLLALRPNVYLLIWMLLMPLTYEVLGDFLCCQQWQPDNWPTVLLGVLYIFTILKTTHYFIKNGITFIPKHI